MNERILVVSPPRLRDMVIAQGLFRALRQERPGAHIAVIAPDHALPLFERMPEVAELVRMPLSAGSLNLRLRLHIARSLRGRFDRAIVLPQSFRSALVPWLAEIPVRTGHGRHRRCLLNDIRPAVGERSARKLCEYVALGLPPDELPVPALIGRPRLRVTAAGQVAAREEFGFDAQRPAIAFLLDSEYGGRKRWPLQHWVELAQALVARGYDLWLFGSAPAPAWVERVRAGREAHVFDLTGRTSVTQTIDALGLTAAAVGCDSALLQMAAAVGVPLIALYGPDDPAEAPPLTPRAVVLVHPCGCTPCGKRHCPNAEPACLTGIAPQEVQSNIERLVHAEV